ncbi:hypothetical protein HU200_023669 [Digitaria exilis]|uniref:Protein TIFY n=1 Tax=Digitaria exilis TaxID=1010633 RepID=A0A835EXF9_9POAL|nr:hypothetical protein HU200_023669 [Digitaria exilis]
MAQPCHARSEAQAQASTMLLMPGADVTREETVAATAQLTVMYGGRVLVFDDVAADKAAAVMRVAQQADVLDGQPADLQVARKASLQRLMEKRRDRLRERAPYAPAARLGVLPPRRGGQEEGDAGTWLELGLPGGCAR